VPRKCREMPSAGVVSTPADVLPVPLPGPVAGRGSGFTSYLQVVPLIANDVGLATLLVQEPWKPSVMLAPAAMVPL